MIRLVHVDNEKPMLDIMKDMLEEFEFVTLQASFDNALTALDYLLENEVDIVVLDIEMPINDGLWLASKIKHTNALIVFLTSYTDYTLKAFDVCAIQYLLKPVTNKMLNNLFERYFRLKDAYKIVEEEENKAQIAQISEVRDNYLNRKSCPKRIFVNCVGQMLVIALAEVYYFEASGANTIVYTRDGQKHVSNKMLKTYVEVLAIHPDFVRIHRSYLVNKAFVKAILRERNKIELLMDNDTKLEVSSLHRNDINSLILK